MNGNKCQTTFHGSTKKRQTNKNNIKTFSEINKTVHLHFLHL